MRLASRKLGLICLALAGCGAQGPSDKTVEDAVRDHISRDAYRGRAQVNSVKVNKCIRAGSDDKFNCYIEVEIEFGSAGRRKARGAIGMVRVPNGWTYEGGLGLQ